jgi:uncharacterized paraquat-inducible protein A
MVKVAALAQVDVGISFWSYAFFNLFLIAAMMHLDKFQLAHAIKSIVRERESGTSGFRRQTLARA